LISTTNLRSGFTECATDKEICPVQFDRWGREERLSLSRELHDTIVQDLIVILMGLRKALEAAVCPRQTRLLEQLTEDVEQGLASARATMVALRGEVQPKKNGNDGENLAEQLDAVLKRAFRHSSLNFTLHCGDSVTLSAAMLPQLTRIVQEAANNIVRHARASQARCVVEIDGDWLQLSISDDGVGMTRSGNCVGIGLIGMRERAQSIGGSISINSKKNLGTSVVVRLRLNQESHAQNNRSQIKSIRGKSSHLVNATHNQAIA